VSGFSEASHDQKNSVVLAWRVARDSGRRGNWGALTAMAARTMGLSRARDGPRAGLPASYVADETIVGRWG